MDSKKHTPIPRRFRVEQIGADVVIFDAETWTYRTRPPGTTRFQAEQQCAQLNGDKPKPQHRTVDRQADLLARFRASGSSSTVVGIGGSYRIRGERETAQHQPARLTSGRTIGAYKSWLVPMLRAWAEAVAAQKGYSGKQRATRSTWSILELIRVGEILLSGAEPAVEALQKLVLATPGDSADTVEQLETLALHYLSVDPAHLKARFLGMSKATYHRHVDAGHRLVARRWLR